MKEKYKIKKINQYDIFKLKNIINTKKKLLFFNFNKNKNIVIILLLLFFIFILILNKVISFKKNSTLKIVAISYSNEKYQTQLKYNKKSAIEIGKVDEYYEYGPNDIEYEFKQKNKDILSKKRGNGYWLWKPYFILKTLKQKLKDGDYLIYTDACILYKDNSRKLIDFLINKKAEIWLYKLGHFEKHWTKRDAFILMDADNTYYQETFQYNAAMQIYRKSKFTENFLNKYLYYSQDKRIITDEPNTQLLSNLDGFRDHRHDQSILSLLVKKYSQANSGNKNIDIKIINSLKSEMPYIFCHYRRMNFSNYEDLKKNCRDS